MMRAKKDLLLTGVALFILSLILTRSPKQAAFRSATSYAYPETSALPTDPQVDSHTGQGHHVHDREEGLMAEVGSDHHHSASLAAATMYVYWPPKMSGMKRPGRKFSVDIRLSRQMKEMSKDFFILNEKTVDKFVFVTAASSNHFEEAIDGVASAQHHFPGKKIFFYDLGLDHQQVQAVKSWKWIHYRKFDFSKYPKYFHENLRMVGWKPIVIQEVMADHGAVFWMDASIRILTSDFRSVYDQVLANGGIMLFKHTKHSNFAATHKGTYEYLPTNRTRQAKTPMCIATAILAYNTKVMFYNVLWWFFICALEERCQAPMAKTMCDFDLEHKWATFANCHKWDQSTLNILLSNYFGYRHHKYLADEEMVAVERWPTHRYTIQVDTGKEQTPTHRTPTR